MTDQVRPHVRGQSLRRVRGVLVAVLVVLVVGVTAFWAGRTTLRPTSNEAQAPDSYVDVAVTDQQLGRVVTFATTVRRAAVPLALNALAGVVTQVADDGEHGAGDVLYRIGQTPVTLVAGGTPFWRDLGQGMSGEDVREAQNFLRSQGFEVAVDGDWGSGTTAAVKAWQKADGRDTTGTIGLGELVASSALPATVSLDRAQLWPGAVLAGGEQVVSIPGGDPTFVMELNSSQAALVPSGTSVTVHADGADWTGAAGDPTTTENGIEVPVTAADGSVVCGSDCGRLPVSGETHLLTDVAVQEPVSGPVVPVAAVTTAADGVTSVTVVHGNGSAEKVAVRVVTIADGLAVVDGVAEGARVRVFGDSDPTAPSGSQVTPSPTSS